MGGRGEEACANQSVARLADFTKLDSAFKMGSDTTRLCCCFCHLPWRVGEGYLMVFLRPVYRKGSISRYIISGRYKKYVLLPQVQYSESLLRTHSTVEDLISLCQKSEVE